MMKTPIYVKSLKLKNIRTFSEAELNLENEDGTIPQWTLIIGDNGIGKSTLLQAIAWMKPLPYSNENKKNSNDTIDPYINDEENETLLRLVRKKAEKPESSGHIEAIFVRNKRLNKKVSIKEDICKTSIDIILKNGELHEVTPGHQVTSKNFYNNNVIIYAYSASRRLGKLNINDPKLNDTITSFLAEKTELLDAENILHTSNYALLGAGKALDDAKNKEDKKKLEKEYQKYLDYVTGTKKMLVSILPNIDDIKDIDIITPKILNQYEIEGDIVLTTKHGSKIPFKNASLGYRTVISWTIDLAWRLFQQFPQSEDPLKEPAIVLIDEIDLHLHPKWQKEIMGNLSSHFPNVQFIATAHSPLMVQAAIKSNYAVVKENEEGIIVLNDPLVIDGWRVDQILTNLFNVSSRSIEVEEIIKRRRLLINKKKRDDNENRELEKLNDQISTFPIMENSENQVLLDHIHKLHSKLKEEGKIHD